MQRGLVAAFRIWIRSQERLLLGALGVGGVFVLWQIAADLNLISRLFFSSPWAVASTGITELQTPRFWSAVQTSGFEFMAGFVGAAVIGVPLGLVIGSSDMLNDLLDPWLTFFYSLPRIALAPIVLLWLGIGLQSIIALVFLGAFFTIIVNTIRGARVVDARILGVAASFGASRWKVFSTVVLPGSIPMILVGLRLGVSRALTGIVVGELFAGGGGLGQMIFLASNSLQIDRMLFALIFLITIGVISVELLARFERRFSRWRDDLSTAG